MTGSTYTRRKSLTDPRTKLLIVFLTSVFVFGGAGGAAPFMQAVRHILTALPLALLLLEGHRRHVLFASCGYALFYLLQITVFGLTKGFFNSVLLFSIGFFVRILPNVMAARYLVASTTVSELVAGLERMHLGRNVIVPITVMVRFFPVILEETRAVSDAMKMRGIRLGGKKSTKMLEYRMIPIITCSVKTGEELSAAALARGLGSPVKRTNMCSIGFRATDYLVFFIAAGTFVCFGMSFMRY